MQRRLLVLSCLVILPLILHAQHGKQELVIGSSTADGDPGAATAVQPSISSTGRYIVFGTTSANLLGGRRVRVGQLVAKDLWKGSIATISASRKGVLANNTSGQAAISDNGRYVAFYSNASNLVPTDKNGFQDVFVKDLKTGAVSLASSTKSGQASNGPSFSISSAARWMSSDGRYVAFCSEATNLVPGVNGLNAYLKNMETGEVEWIAPAWNVTISADARYIAYTARTSAAEVRIWDRLTNVTVSMADSFRGYTFEPQLSHDGQRLGFYHRPMAGGNAMLRVVDFHTGQSWASPVAGLMSPDGRYIVYNSVIEGIRQVLMYDLFSGKSTLISSTPSGERCNGWSAYGVASRHGRFVAFYSEGNDLVTGGNRSHQIFVKYLK